MCKFKRNDPNWRIVESQVQEYYANIDQIAEENQLQGAFSIQYHCMDIKKLR
jgi:hypothetical protein